MFLGKSKVRKLRDQETAPPTRPNHRPPRRGAPQRGLVLRHSGDAAGLRLGSRTGGDVGSFHEVARWREVDEKAMFCFVKKIKVGFRL